MNRTSLVRWSPGLPLQMPWVVISCRPSAQWVFYWRFFCERKSPVGGTRIIRHGKVVSGRKLDPRKSALDGACWEIESCHDANFGITSDIRGCRCDSLQCHQWWQSWHGDDFQFPVQKGLNLYHLDDWPWYIWLVMIMSNFHDGSDHTIETVSLGCGLGDQHTYLSRCLFNMSTL